MKEHTVDIKIVVDREYKFAFNEKEKKKNWENPLRFG